MNNRLRNANGIYVLLDSYLTFVSLDMKLSRQSTTIYRQQNSQLPTKSLQNNKTQQKTDPNANEMAIVKQQ